MSDFMTPEWNSFERRLEAAMQERENAMIERDRLYPGGREWEDANGKVEEWDSTIRELRREMNS